MKDTEIYIEPDYTPTERKRNQLMRTKAKQERNLGKKVEMKNNAIKIDDIWYTWNEQKEDWAPGPVPRIRNVTRNSQNRLSKNTLEPAA